LNLKLPHGCTGTELGLLTAITQSSSKIISGKSAKTGVSSLVVIWIILSPSLILYAVGDTILPLHFILPFSIAFE